MFAGKRDFVALGRYKFVVRTNNSVPTVPEFACCPGVHGPKRQKPQEPGQERDAGFWDEWDVPEVEFSEAEAACQDSLILGAKPREKSPAVNLDDTFYHNNLAAADEEADLQLALHLSSECERLCAAPAEKSVIELSDSLDGFEPAAEAVKQQSENEVVQLNATTDSVQSENEPVQGQKFFVFGEQRTDMHGKFKGYLTDNTADFSDEDLDGDLRQSVFDTLHNVFGFRDFRHCQKAVITAVLKKHDCFILMPTGAGKSLCYQLPAVVSGGVTVVVSPLRSLMSDQVQKLELWKVPCFCLQSGLTRTESDRLYADLNSADVQIRLLYVTPEMLSVSTTLRNALASLRSRGKLDRFVIDEVHCISQWGHDFRPDYARLAEYFKELGRVQVIGLTATATPNAVIDIKRTLRMHRTKLFISSFARPNLIYDLVPKSAASFKKVMTLLTNKYPGQSGIIYCLSRKDTEQVAENLVKMGVSASPYHADLSNSVRDETQRAWMSGKVLVICATIAFGMGIDKPDVRFVVHHSLSASIEAYYQETGRAGRDGLPAVCILMYSFHDHTRHLKLLENSHDASVGMRQLRLQNIYQVVAYAENVTVCRRKLLVEHFGEFYDSATCNSSSTPCSICEQSRSSIPLYRAYDFTEEAVLVLQCVKKMSKTTLNSLVSIYHGSEDKKGKKGKKFSRKNQQDTAAIAGRGEEFLEDDVHRFMRKLVVEGLLEEQITLNNYVGVDVCYVNVSAAGETFLQKKEPRVGDEAGKSVQVYSHLSVGQRRLGPSKLLSSMTAVSEAMALKEKYRLKHVDVFKGCADAIRQLLCQIVAEEGHANTQAIITNEGVEQLAAMLPRTNSEMLQIDSMTSSKLQRFGARIMERMQPFWKQVDDREHSRLERAVSGL